MVIIVSSKSHCRTEYAWCTEVWRQLNPASHTVLVSMHAVLTYGDLWIQQVTLSLWVCMLYWHMVISESSKSHCPCEYACCIEIWWSLNPASHTVLMSMHAVLTYGDHWIQQVTLSLWVCMLYWHMVITESSKSHCPCEYAYCIEIWWSLNPASHTVLVSMHAVLKYGDLWIQQVTLSLWVCMLYWNMVITESSKSHCPCEYACCIEIWWSLNPASHTVLVSMHAVFKYGDLWIQQVTLSLWVCMLYWNMVITESSKSHCPYEYACCIEIWWSLNPASHTVLVSMHAVLKYGDHWIQQVTLSLWVCMLYWNMVISESSKSHCPCEYACCIEIWWSLNPASHTVLVSMHAVLKYGDHWIQQVTLSLWVCCIQIWWSLNPASHTVLVSMHAVLKYGDHWIQQVTLSLWVCMLYWNMVISESSKSHCPCEYACCIEIWWSLNPASHTVLVSMHAVLTYGDHWIM